MQVYVSFALAHGLFKYESTHSAEIFCTIDTRHAILPKPELLQVPTPLTHFSLWIDWFLRVVKVPPLALRVK